MYESSASLGIEFLPSRGSLFVKTSMRKSSRLQRLLRTLSACPSRFCFQRLNLQKLPHSVLEYPPSSTAECQSKLSWRVATGLLERLPDAHTSEATAIKQATSTTTHISLLQLMPTLNKDLNPKSSSLNPKS